MIRPIMYLALSYDHRIIDGKESVSFLKMVNNAGFGNAKYCNLTMGVACLHSGWKI